VADSEKAIVKERRRWHIDFRGMRMYVNLDQLLDPPHPSFYLEIKSRTWSLKDAEEKARAISTLLDYLAIEKAALMKEEYVSFTSQHEENHESQTQS
jgi:5-methylthioadenosine/S-adenosylhomocysteine deaminase